MKILSAISMTGALIATCALWSSAVLADRDGTERMESWHNQNNGWHGAGQQRPDALVRAVREGTRRFRDVVQAEAEGYGLFLACVSGPDEGAMGVHYVNGNLVANAALDPEKPEALVYEPAGDGRLRLVAAEFVVLAADWEAAGNPAPPSLLGQTFHFIDSPNRFGLPAFYALHVWAWKDNSHGTFVNFNPRVSCEGYVPQK